MATIATELSLAAAVRPRLAPHRNVATAGVFAAVYVALFVHAYRIGSKAVWDAPVSIFLVVVVLAVSSWARLSPRHIVLLNVPLLAHNIGLIGDAALYGTRIGPLPYDKLVHALATFVLGVLTARAMHLRLALGAWPAGILAFSFVMLLGISVEVCEFLGYLYLPQSSGFFNPSAGPSALAGIEMYKDTMSDILTNAAGAAAGVVGFEVRSTRSH